uniref:MROH2B-like HEAT-repeats domain-containing protein n=1 Tax=Vombatus ursinus TaxID=29139 RepID=A0A4X2LU83_VOMUR
MLSDYHLTHQTSELEDIYQDAASNVLLAMCKHSWNLVFSKIEEDFLTGIFPHRSLLYVYQVVIPCITLTLYLSQTFLFIYYGMILRAANNSSMVRKHLRSLLDTSHQSLQQREGIALTIGLTAARHLDDAWAVLDQFGRTGPLKRILNIFNIKVVVLYVHKGALPPPLPHLFTGTLNNKGSMTHNLSNEEDPKWRWASSTILLSYGQMATKAKENILPWVDNISSRMVFYFRSSYWDDTLKQSFLEAVLLLVGAISRNEGAHSYEFTQVPELIDSLLVLMKKEPQDTLCTTIRQQVMCAISGLCKLRPVLDFKKKSKILFTCFQSVFKLPLVEALEKHTCLLADPPDIQVMPPAVLRYRGVFSRGGWPISSIRRFIFTSLHQEGNRFMWDTIH